MDDHAAVAVCTLTTRPLAALLRHAPGVAMAEPLMTANLGIEELVRAVLRRPDIHTVLVCGQDSPLFRQGQSLLALSKQGVRAGDNRIIGAEGYQPYLPGLRPEELDVFRSLVSVVDLREVVDPAVLTNRIAELAGRPAGTRPVIPQQRPSFQVLRPGGRRVPIRFAGAGFFVVSVDRESHQVVLRHYRDDFTAGHEMRGHKAESMVLGVIAAGLVDDLGHAGYLGGELMKAESALRLGLDYEQDKPLRSATGPPAREKEDTMPATLSFTQFARYLGDALELGDRVVDPEVPLGEQFEVDSARMIELAIALEQDCGLDLPDDVDLRKSTPQELFESSTRYDA